MEPINRVAPTGPPASFRSRQVAGGASFSVDEGASARQASVTIEADSVAEASAAGLLTLQEDAAPGDVRDRAARRRGYDLLAELAALQRELLAGDPGADRLARLAVLAEQVPDATDPRLRDALAAIALRARVEVARYGGR